MDQHNRLPVHNLPAEAFLNPGNFLTAFDSPGSQRWREKYEHGLDLGKRARYVVISTENTWSVEFRLTEDEKARGVMSSSVSNHSEAIGVHADTYALLQGFLWSGCAIVVCRLHLNTEQGSEGWFTRTNIRNNKSETDLFGDLEALL